MWRWVGRHTGLCVSLTSCYTVMPPKLSSPNQVVSATLSVRSHTTKLTLVTAMRTKSHGMAAPLRDGGTVLLYQTALRHWLDCSSRGRRKTRVWGFPSQEGRGFLPLGVWPLPCWTPLAPRVLSAHCSPRQLRRQEGECTCELFIQWHTLADS